MFHVEHIYKTLKQKQNKKEAAIQRPLNNIFVFYKTIVHQLYLSSARPY